MLAYLPYTLNWLSLVHIEFVVFKDLKEYFKERIITPKGDHVVHGKYNKG